MSTFNAKRVRHEYTQTNDAPPEKVFPLLCPVREADWVPGWKYRLVYSESGFAEDGCVFSTPNDAGPDSIWMLTHYDPATYTIAYAWVEPGMIATQLRISLAPAPGGKTRRAHSLSLHGIIGGWERSARAPLHPRVVRKKDAGVGRCYQPLPSHGQVDCSRSLGMKTRHHLKSEMCNLRFRATGRY